MSRKRRRGDGDGDGERAPSGLSVVVNSWRPRSVPPPNTDLNPTLEPLPTIPSSAMPEMRTLTIVLQSIIGVEITVEMKNDMQFTGKLVRVDKTMG